MALILLVIGLSSLFTYSTVYSPTSYDPRELQKKHIGENVRLHGSVHEVVVKEKVTFIRLDDRPGLDIVSFDRIDHLSKNTTITIYGTVDLYNGDLEVLADRITVTES